MSTQPLDRVIREFLARMVSTGAPTEIDQPFSPAGFRILLARKRVRGSEDLLAQFTVRAPTSVMHHVWSSEVVCPGLSELDAAVVREDIETILFRYLNPLDVIRGDAKTVWLLSETEQSQLTRVLALSPDDEVDFIFLTGSSAQWTGPIRGLHKTMATLAHLLSRHPDFATGKVLCRPAARFLFLAEARGIDRLSSIGISIDGRSVPSRGIFAFDTNSYMDVLIQLGEDDARDLAVVEFLYGGSCIRAQGPLGIPLYRIPHAVPASAVQSITQVDGNRPIYEAAYTVVP
jgi:hypothetical protein